jgi:hypothetical protein
MYDWGEDWVSRDEQEEIELDWDFYNTLSPEEQIS